ncbi:MAG: hypothetical protein JNG89_00205 [Planctomycetaceae bacterium]|nr:hypothetical protein [Planctomycetaceae bacterium]
MFYRLNTDGTRRDVELGDLFAGPVRTACWIVGGGPSLSELPCAEIARAPAAKLGINLGGAKLIRPTMWTSYDPSARFQRSVYLDASIWKFVHARRAMDLVPETTFKVCECPCTLFFEREPQRGFADFLPAAATGIVDWNDTFVQAMEIAYRLGFRVLYLAGCDFHVRPSEAQIARARAAEVEYAPRELLGDFYERCSGAGVSRAELESLDPPTQYHFDERKPLAAAIQTDQHYFRTAQYLRLCRRALSLAGLELVSVTPDSRLNDHFPYRPVDDVLADLGATIGRPDAEPTRGLYTRVGTRTPAGVGPMRDLKPHHWKRKGEPPAECAAALTPAANPRSDSDARVRASVARRVAAAIDALPETPVRIDEDG